MSSVTGIPLLPLTEAIIVVILLPPRLTPNVPCRLVWHYGSRATQIGLLHVRAERGFPKEGGGVNA